MVTFVLVADSGLEMKEAVQRVRTNQGVRQLMRA
jgi:hypothetical protein